MNRGYQPISMQDGCVHLIKQDDVCVFQVMGNRCHSAAVFTGSDLGVRPDVCQREHSHNGVSLHHLQLSAGHVHLHISLRAAEEGLRNV